MDCKVTGIIMSLLLMAALPPALSQSPPPNYHSVCSHPYKCGELELYYPFWGENRPRQCGGHDKLRLFCTEKDDGYGGKIDYAYIEAGSQRFNVVGKDEPQKGFYWVKLIPLPVADGGFDVCSGDSGYSVDYPLLMYNQTVHNITIFYDCSYLSPSDQNLGCAGGDVVYYNGTEKEVLESHKHLQNCVHRIQVAAEAVALNGEGGDDASAMHFGEGVLVNYTFSQDCERCFQSEGSCGSNDTHPFTCYCSDGSNALQCPHHDPPAVPQGKSMSLLSPHIFLLQFPTLLMNHDLSSFILGSWAWIKD